jgi:glycosyltransferase involved in cell wall biosynthesis
LRIHVLASDIAHSGGAAVYNQRLIPALAARGHQVTLICQQAPPSLRKCCTVVTVPPYRAKTWPLLWRISPLLAPWEARRGMVGLQLTRPDVVLTGEFNLSWAYAAQFPDVPMILVGHALLAPREVASYPYGSPVQRWAAIKAAKRGEQWLLNRCRFTVRFTQSSCDEIAKYYGRSIRPRFVRFAPAVEIPTAIASGGRPHSPVRLLSIGRLVETKNVHYTLGVLSRLQSLPWQLDVVGDGPERARLEAITSASGLADRVAFHGHLNDVSRFYETSDLLLFPSRLEYAPLVILEAMSHGVPSISVAADGRRYFNANHEIVSSGEDGWIEAGETTFENRLRQLLTNPSALTRVGLNARRTAETRHSWHSHIDQFEKLFAELSVEAIIG